MSTDTVLIPPVGGMRYVLYDAASRDELEAELTDTMRAEATSAACDASLAEVAALANNILGTIGVQQLAETAPTVNRYRIPDSWAGGCWFTPDQMTRVTLWTNRWAALQDNGCVAAPAKASSGIYLGTRSDRTTFAQATTFSAKESDVETKFVTTMSVLGQSDDEGAISDDDEGTYAPPAESRPMSTGVKLALGAGALLAVVLIVRGLR